MQAFGVSREMVWTVRAKFTREMQGRAQPIACGATECCAAWMRRTNARPKTASLVTSASAATPTAAATAISAAVSTTASAVASTASAMFSLGTRLIYVERASADLGAVQRRDGLVALFIAGHFHKTESARAPGITIGHDAHPVHLSEGCKHLA